MVVFQEWCFELGFMPSNHYSGSDISRPEMWTMGIMNRARGMQIVENGFHVRMMFLLLGLLLSIVNLPIAFGENDMFPTVGNSVPNTSSPSAPDLPSPPSGGTSLPPSVGSPSPSPGGPPPFPGGPPPPLPPPPPSAAIEKTGGDTWNESEKAGVVIASIAALLQVAVVAFLLIKRHQMLTTVEYDDIEDLEYDTPPDSNFRNIESA